MPPPTGTPAEERGLLDNALCETRKQHAVVLGALSGAQDALERAQKAVDDLSAEDMRLRARCAGLVSYLSSWQAMRVRSLLAILPVELLQAIFLDASDCEGVWRGSTANWGRSYSVRDDAAPPFILAAVNRRWRSVAIQTSRLWSFLGLPALGRPSSHVYLDYVRVVLERSKACDLDFLLSWDNCIWDQSDLYRVVFETLARHSHRWRRVSIMIPMGTPASALQFLHSPFPRLEDVYLGATSKSRGRPALGIGWGPTSATYLAFCPRLRRLRNGYLFIAPQQPFMHLVQLAIAADETVPTHALWSMLRMTPALRTLQIHFRSPCPDPPNMRPDDPIELAHLEVLGIHGPFDPFLPWLEKIRMPRLQEFCTVNVDAFDVLCPLLDKISETVITLVICELDAARPGPFAPLSGAMQHVRRLHRVRRVVFRDCKTLGPDVPAIFASRATSGLAHLEDVAVEDPVMGDEGAIHVSSLMQAIQSHAASGGKDALHFSLTADPDEVPKWLLQQYAYVAGQRD